MPNLYVALCLRLAAVHEGPDFDGMHLYKVVSMLASKETDQFHFFEYVVSLKDRSAACANQDLLEDTRADRIYRLFLESSAVQVFKLFCDVSMI